MPDQSPALKVFHTCFYSSNQSVLHFCHFSLIYPQETVPQFMWKFLQTWYVLVFFLDSQPLLYPPINTIHIQCFTSFKVQIVFFIFSGCPHLHRAAAPLISSICTQFVVLQSDKHKGLCEYFSGLFKLSVMKVL